ncbi:protein-export chaperone SecB [Tepidicella xavieri]|jgi:preprotein translocase subunit SecB|uniref:Protein-export protein SecB n=1 Tax=Tepidicella xavieri TaxID=360241 RepID=A0A4R6UDQ9_9BURK|nr:protein-export chaperone SecB [Tepidicella xavieri]TDQ44848.1 protein translocase subunit secB [Tepidicella xavieri]
MADQLTPVFQIQRVYLKEASLEQPNSPAILLEQEQPSVDIQLGVAAEPVADGIFEVSVTCTVQTKIKDKTVFLVEAKQAGIFELRNLPQEQMGPILGIACPQIVYPYLRGNVADLIQRGGFPPVHLAEINFQAMYEQQQLQDAAAAQAPAQ